MPYFPSKPPLTTTEDGTALAFYLEDELVRLASSLLDDVQALEVRPAHTAPLRPRAGTLAYADGTDWNPGTGEGLYNYTLAGNWTFVGSLGGGPFLPLTGGTLTGDLTIAKATPSFVLNKSASGQNAQMVGQTAGSARWGLTLGNATAEGGANAGSNFNLSRFSDAGAFIDSPIFIERSTGIATFSASPLAPTPVATDNSTKLSTTAFIINRDHFNVKDYGAVGNGVTDDTAAIQAALAAATAAGGGKVRLTNGTFIISGPLTVADNVSLVGEGSTMTTIKASNTAQQMITLSGLYPQIRGFAVDMTGTPTAGNQIQALGSGTFGYTIDDILIKNCWNGMIFLGTSNAARMSIGYVTNLKVWNFQNIGIYIQYCNDIFFQNTLVYQKDVGLNVGFVALYMTDNCEAINFDSADFVGGSYSMVMTSAAAGTHGARPAYNSFHACYFDSAANGTLIQAGVLTSFTSCWFSTGGLGGVATAYGIDIVTCDSLLFTNCRFHTNAKHGAVVESGGLRVGFVNCTFEDNSVLAAAHAGHGLVIADSANGVEVFGGFARNGDLPSAQGYGIFIGATVTNVTINGVDVNGNFTGGLSSATQIGSTTCSVKDCKGFVSEARGQSIVLNGTSSLAVAHGLGGTPQMVVCTLLDTGGGAQAAGVNIPRVLLVGTVNFTFDIGVVATANRPFSWEAKL